MGNTRNGDLWYYAICATRYTDNMHGIGRFYGIFSSSRRRNYQTSSIPSRLAPMSFLFDRKKRTMPSRYMKYEYFSNNSMALRIRYHFFFFKILTLCIEGVVWDKVFFFKFYLIYQETHFSVTNLFCFHTEELLKLFTLY